MEPWPCNRIYYYLGDGNLQTAVALQDLGPGPFEESNGTVVRFRQICACVLTLKKKSGGEESSHLSQKTVAETPYGAVEALELDAKDGDQLQVTASSRGWKRHHGVIHPNPVRPAERTKERSSCPSPIASGRPNPLPRGYIYEHCHIY